MTKATLKRKKPPVEKEVIEIGPCSPMQELVFQRATEVDFMIIGGSRGGGKSEVITQLALEHKDDPKFNGIYMRTQYDQLLGAGGLWEIASKYYPLFGAKSVKSPTPTYTFPSKAKVRFKQCANTSDAEKHRGLQYSMVALDEISQLPKEAVLALLACLRSEAKMNSFCVGTCNPHKENWIFDLVHWYLDEKGYPDESKNGKIRYFVTKDNDFIFADDEDWFKENMPETVYSENRMTGETSYIPPKKFCFIQLSIFHNKILLDLNPRYLSELQNLPEHEREKQLYGNWFAEEETVSYFDRKWVRGINGERAVKQLPLNCRKIRAWDKASTEFSPKLGNSDADFTACIGMAKSKEGYYYIYGDFHPDNYDPYEKVYGKFRKRAGERNTIMLQQAVHDGSEVPILIAQDAGADGKSVFQDLVREFASNGFVVKGSSMAVQTKKLVRFEPFVSACQAGLVFIVEDSFPDQRTLDAFYRELESFAPSPDGKWRSTRLIKDDWVDVIGDCYNYLAKEKVHTLMRLPTIDAPSIKKQLDL